MDPLRPPLERFPPEYARRPQGMLQAENAVWQAFRVANQGALTALYFNVHVGTVPGLDATTTAAENSARTTLWSKRIDVVAEAYREVWLIECKTAARPSAIGQLLTYIPLLADRNATWTDPRPLLVAGTVDPDAFQLATTLNFEILTPPFRRLAPRDAAL